MTEFEAKVLLLLEAINTNLVDISTKLGARKQESLEDKYKSLTMSINSPEMARAKDLVPSILRAIERGTCFEQFRAEAAARLPQPKNDDPNLNQIKALIVLNGTSLSEIARSAGVSRQWVSMVVNGHRKSRRVRKAVAEALGISVEDLWPNGNNKAA